MAKSNRTSPVTSSFTVQQADQDTSGHSSTLVLLYGFYGASNRALQKYINIYIGYGFDVLLIKSHLRHFAWPRCARNLAEHTLQNLHDHCLQYSNIVVHAFSMGAYNFIVCLMTVSQPKDDLIINKFVAVVYDSLSIGSLRLMVTGIAGGISKNRLVRWLFTKALNSYLFVSKTCTVNVYNRALEFFKNSPVNTPTLVFYCKNDRMSNWEVIEEHMKEWLETHNVRVEGKKWEESRHSAHLMVHEEEYLQALDRFFLSIPTLAGSIKWNSKL